MPVAAGLYFHLAQDGVVETPPIVLLHGVGGMHLLWPPQIRRLPGYRIFTLDLPGHGKSALGGGLQTIDSYAEKVLAWMEAVHLPRAVFIGHCMGSAVALTLGIQHSAHVLGLGLLSASPCFNFPPDLLSDAVGSATFYKAIASLVALSFASSAPADLVELITNRLSEARPSVFYGDLVACERFNCTEHLANLRLPTLILCGAEDHLTPLRYSQLMARAIPGAMLEVIPQSGHMLIVEQPEVVAKFLEIFLRKIPYHAGEVNWYVSGD
jgi:pimeloyl-ACP methyl ester carboxylesterase